MKIITGTTKDNDLYYYLVTFFLKTYLKLLNIEFVNYNM